MLLFSKKSTYKVELWFQHEIDISDVLRLLFNSLKRNGINLLEEPSISNMGYGVIMGSFKCKGNMKGFINYASNIFSVTYEVKSDSLISENILKEANFDFTDALITGEYHYKISAEINGKEWPGFFKEPTYL